MRIACRLWVRWLAGLLSFRCLVCVLLSLSAEMLTDSLASGCYFPKFFYLRSRKWLSFLVSHAVILEAWNLHFGSLGNHFGTLGAPWETVGAAARTSGGLESKV